MNYSIFHFIHLLSVFLLLAASVYAIAAARGGDTSVRKKLLMYSGIASLVAFLSGFGLLGILKAGFPLWAIVKIVMWLALSAVAGMAFRLREQHKVLVLATACLVFLALAMVAFKPI